MYANSSTSFKSDSTLLKAILLNISPLIPIINLKYNQNTKHYRQNLPNGIHQVFAGFIIGKKVLTYLAEEAEYGSVGYPIKLQKTSESFEYLFVEWVRS